MKAVAPVMQRQGRGSIINTSSIAGLIGLNYVLAYVASKFAIRGMTRSAALEFGPFGIRVNSVHPGTIDTPMIHDPIFGEVDKEAFAKAVPLGRMGEVEDIANLMLFLASDESSYCTGAEFVIDGGDTCGARR
jgi:3alpha(or 20beta)-hydroxysteroid dehydrogenase